MATFVDQFGNKSAGELIRAELWNKLMSALDELSTSVDTRFDTVDGTLTQLTTQVTTLNTEVTQLTSDVGAVKTELAQYYKVSLSTTRISYATGEEATIVAQVSDLLGQPVQFADNARPWIDFVTVWGHLRPADGFESQTGDSSGGERGISVRTNGAGVAHVLLRADVAPDLPVEAHADVAAALTTKLADKRSVAQAILEAPTPIDAKNAGAFAAMATEYDRPQATGVRPFLDTYYVHKAPAVIGKIAPPIVSPRWRDYASIVVAVARADADPTTPDAARGAGSIRIAFRDWIGPWLTLHYFDPIVLQPAITDFRTRLEPHFTADYFDSVTRLRDEVTTLVPDDRGLVGRIRDLQAVHGALDGVTVSQPADLVQKVSQTVQQAVVLQQTLEPVQAGTLAAVGGHLALNALTSSTSNAATDVTAVKAQVASIQTKVDTVGAQVDSAHQTLATLDGRVTEASSTLAGISTSVTSVHDQVTKVQELYPDSVKQQFLQLKGAVLDVQAIKTHLNLP
jgi:outer membrane murein-binding lipoprotein Lpp